MKKMDFMWKNNLFTELSTLSTMDRLWMNCVKTKYMFCSKRKKRRKMTEVLDFFVV